MTFIITLISLVIERFFHWSHLRQWRWFNKYQQWLCTRIANWPAVALLILCILPLLIVVGGIYHFLNGWLYGIPKILFGVVVLLYCMGPYNLWAQVYSCLTDLNKEDPKVAIDRAQAAFGITIPNDSQAFHQAITRAIFVAAEQRVFAVVFWFVILGPVGAVLYRSILVCAQQSDAGLAQIAASWQRVLDWIPARLFTFLFALGGHFTNVFNLWKKDAKKGIHVNDALIAECGIAALGVDGQPLVEDGSAEKLALDLLDRVFVIGLVILALVVLIVRNA